MYSAQNQIKVFMLTAPVAFAPMTILSIKPDGAYMKASIRLNKQKKDGVRIGFRIENRQVYYRIYWSKKFKEIHIPASEFKRIISLLETNDETYINRYKDKLYCIVTRDR